MRRLIAGAAVFGVLFAIAGCSEPPNKEHDQAVAAIAAARDAGAALYAAAELAAADASIGRYAGLVTQGDYKQALGAALDARERGFEAAKTAAAKQKSLRAEADQLLTSLTAALAVADARASAAPASAARHAKKLRQTRKAAAIAMQEARAQLEAGELTKAVKRLVDANAAMTRDIAAVTVASPKPKK